MGKKVLQNVTRRERKDKLRETKERGTSASKFPYSVQTNNGSMEGEQTVIGDTTRHVPTSRRKQGGVGGHVTLGGGRGEEG